MGQKQKVGPVQDHPLDGSAQRFGSKPPPEIWIALGQMLRIFLERLAGRPGSSQSGFALGIVAHVALAAVFLEDSLRDVVDLLELPCAIGTWWNFQLRQAVGI